jgi:hypothetical protein
MASSSLSAPGCISSWRTPVLVLPKVEDPPIDVEVGRPTTQHLPRAAAVHGHAHHERELVTVELRRQIAIPVLRRDEDGLHLVVAGGPGQLRRLLLEGHVQHREHRRVEVPVDGAGCGVVGP